MRTAVLRLPLGYVITETPLGEYPHQYKDTKNVIL